MSRDSAGQIQTRCLWSLLTSSVRNIDRCPPLSIDSTPSSAEDMGSRPSKMFLAGLDYSCAPVFPTEWTQSGPGPAFHNSGGKSCHFSCGLGFWSELSPPRSHTGWKNQSALKLNHDHLCACEISLLLAIMFLRFCFFLSLCMLVSGPAVGGWLHCFLTKSSGPSAERQKWTDRPFGQASTAIWNDQLFIFMSFFVVYLTYRRLPYTPKMTISVYS